MEGGQHAGIRIKKISEVVVRGVLAAERGVVLGHLSLDEGVAHAGAHRGAAELGYELRHGLRRDEVVDDRGAGVGGEVLLGDHGADRRGRDGLALLVDDEAAVGVSVKGDAQIRALVHGELLQVHEVFRVQRVGFVVGEVSVEFEVERVNRQRGLLEHRGDGEPAHAIACIHGHGQGANVERDQRVEVVRVVLQHILVGVGARLAVVVRHAGDEFLGDAVKPGFLAHGARSGAAHLDSVVFRRVVGGGEHGSGAVQGAGGVVQLVGAGQAEADSDQALTVDALDEGCGQCRGAIAHVVAHHDLLGAFLTHEAAEAGSDVADEVGADLPRLLTNDSTNVIGLDRRCYVFAGIRWHVFGNSLFWVISIDLSCPRGRCLSRRADAGGAPWWAGFGGTGAARSVPARPPCARCAMALVPVPPPLPLLPPPVPLLRVP